MHIDRSEFGSITIDGKTYGHDVTIGLGDKVSKRKKKLSKEQYGTSHVVSEAEAKFVFEKGCDLIIIGSGQEGNVRLSPEAEDYFAKKGCDVVLRPTQEAIQLFNRSTKRKIALMHVTC
ncbi:MAG: Mth938-like domain-containing protein [Acidocella sp.]|uniref:Mth938-like domain-containing protein n=1 Tax=Acidocella sp. TaxID=50710 RepID=UPI003FD83791